MALRSRWTQVRAWPLGLEPGCSLPTSPTPPHLQSSRQWQTRPKEAAWAGGSEAEGFSVEPSSGVCEGLWGADAPLLSWFWRGCGGLGSRPAVSPNVNAGLMLMILSVSVFAIYCSNLYVKCYKGTTLMQAVSTGKCMQREGTWGLCPPWSILCRIALLIYRLEVAFLI